MISLFKRRRVRVIYRDVSNIDVFLEIFVEGKKVIREELGRKNFGPKDELVIQLHDGKLVDGGIFIPMKLGR